MYVNKPGPRRIMRRAVLSRYLDELAQVTLGVGICCFYAFVRPVVSQFRWDHACKLLNALIKKCSKSPLKVVQKCGKIAPKVLVNVLQKCP